MKIYFAASNKFPADWSYISFFTELATLDKIGKHIVTTDPENADLVLFVDPQLPHPWTLDAIRSDPLVSKYPHKTFIYDERDLNWCVLPGIYPSVLASVYDARRQRAYSYLRNFGTPLTDEALAKTALPDLLFSFMGADNHRVRRQVLGLTHPRAYLEDTARVKTYDFSRENWDQDTDEIAQRRQLFADVMGRSKYILCPRGMGASSFRIFETLRAGRVPVIISDEWTEPEGPDWGACSLRVREADVKQIPALLEAREDSFEQMSQKALQVYAEWFAPDVIFHQIMEKCQELLHLGARPISYSPLFSRQYHRCGLDLKMNHLKYKARLLKARVSKQEQV